jgi:hypothetical protein
MPKARCWVRRSGIAGCPHDDRGAGAARGPDRARHADGRPRTGAHAADHRPGGAVRGLRPAGHSARAQAKCRHRPGSIRAAAGAGRCLAGREILFNWYSTPSRRARTQAARQRGGATRPPCGANSRTRTRKFASRPCKAPRLLSVIRVAVVTVFQCARGIAQANA